MNISWKLPKKAGSTIINHHETMEKTWKIMGFPRRIGVIKIRSKWPQSRRPSPYWGSSSVRCLKKGMDGFFFMCLLACSMICPLEYVSMLFHVLFKLDSIGYGIGHCHCIIRVVRFEDYEWFEIVGIGWTESLHRYHRLNRIRCRGELRIVADSGTK